MQASPEHQTAMHRAIAWLGVVHPTLFAAAYVLDRFAITNTAVPELTRPLLLAVVIAACLTALLWALLRNRYWAALLATVILLVLVIHPIPALVMTTLVAWWAGVGLLRRRGGRTVPSLASTHLPVRIASAYGVVLVLAGLWASADAFTARIANPPDLPLTAGDQGGPNIYLVMLDGYPRADTISSEFGFDNTRFESELASLGFEVASDARANHNKTWLTVATLLNGQYVEAIPEIADPPAAAPAQVRLSHALINDGAVLEHLRARGYEVVSIPSPVMSSDVTADARVWTSPHLNSFEIALVSASLPAYVFPGPVLDYLAADARTLVDDQLDAVAESAAEASGRPRLLLAHLMSPHPPFVLGQDPEYLSACFPGGCKVWETTVEETRMSSDEYAGRMRTQIEHLNDGVISTLRRVVSADPSAVVVVLSDHGARHDADAADEHFRILFAARTPGYELFTDDQSPVNVFRRILSEVFGEPLAVLPYRAFGSDWRLPLLLSEYR